MLAYMWLTLAAAGGTRAGPSGTLVAEMRETVAARLLAGATRAGGRRWPATGDRSTQPAPQVASPPRALTDEEVLGKSAAVEDVQAKLAALGYDPGPADGVMGWRTRAAIRAFQADVGLPVDGQISDRLIAALSDAGANGRKRCSSYRLPQTLVARARAQNAWERYAKQRRLEGTGTGFVVGRRMARSSPITTWWPSAPRCASGRPGRMPWLVPWSPVMRATTLRC